MTTQNIRERIMDRVERGELTTDQGNVEMVRAERVRVVTRLPAAVRKALNAAVKRGELGYMPKDGHKPACYHHPTFDYLAHAERSKREQATIHAIKRIAGWPNGEE